MPRNNLNMDDLDYLSEQGFERIMITETDLAELKDRIKIRVRFKMKVYYSLLAIGVLISGGAAWLFLTAPGSQPPASQPVVVEILPVIQNHEPITIHESVASDENKMKSFNNNIENVNRINDVNTTESVEPLIPKPVPIRELNIANVHQLKYSVNAPLFYIHGYKVTNYTTLYFKTVKTIEPGGVAATYENKDGVLKRRMKFEEYSQTFLHEQLAEALLALHNEDYSRCLYLLHEISAYNKEDLNCLFYSGMCYYNKQHYQAAIKMFDQCIESANNAFYQEAKFYKSASLWELGKKEEAMVYFNEIREEGYFYSERALNYIGK